MGERVGGIDEAGGSIPPISNYEIIEVLFWLIDLWMNNFKFR